MEPETSCRMMIRFISDVFVAKRSRSQKSRAWSVNSAASRSLDKMVLTSSGVTFDNEQSKNIVPFA